MEILWGREVTSYQGHDRRISSQKLLEQRLWIPLERVNYPSVVGVFKDGNECRNRGNSAAIRIRLPNIPPYQGTPWMGRLTSGSHG